MRITELVTPVFLFTIALRRKVSKNMPVDYGEAKREVLGLFARLEREASNHALTDRWNRAKIALAYLVDEVAIMESWSGADLWNNHSLEIEYLRHNEKMRAEWFFDREYKDAIESGDGEMMEILYTCLCLGFEGKYRGQTAQLKNQIDNLFARLPLPYRDRPPEEKLLPAAYTVDKTERHPIAPMRVVTVLTVLAGIVITYFVVNQVMYERFVGQLGKIAGSLSIVKSLP